MSHTQQPAQDADYVVTPLEERMAAAIIFMPEIGDLTSGVTKEIIRRCARVAVEFGARHEGSTGQDLGDSGVGQTGGLSDGS